MHEYEHSYSYCERVQLYDSIMRRKILCEEKEKKKKKS